MELKEYAIQRQGKAGCGFLIAWIIFQGTHLGWVLTFGPGGTDKECLMV